jgi:hypothetical protein
MSTVVSEEPVALRFGEAGQETSVKADGILVCLFDPENGNVTPKLVTSSTALRCLISQNAVLLTVLLSNSLQEFHKVVSTLLFFGGENKCY